MVLRPLGDLFAASCHEKDTGSFIGRDLLTPRRERQRERDRDRDQEYCKREREGGISSFRFLHTRICWCLASSILNRM